jgi:hypothetical protein
VSIWRAVRRDVAGARRSLRYDLAREIPAPDDETELIYPEFEAHERRPRRRALGAGWVGVLVLSGAVGTYFAVVGGLGALLDERAAPALDPLPAVADGQAATPTAASPAAATSTTRPSPPPRRPATTAVLATSPRVTASSTCTCVTPPVPTPASPPPPAPSVSPSSTGSPSPTPPDPTPTGPSPTPMHGR